MQIYQEKPLKLISVDQTGKYLLELEGRNFIQSIPHPIAVISVAGLYRTGKSYLLNRMLLNRSNGFGVGPTINPCTKGLWCWGTPIKGTTQDGEKVNVVIIDTEGIGALDEDQNHDTKIFTLAILLSSCFIYNSVGSIDENAIQNLSLVVNLTKNIQVKATSSQQQDDPDEISQYFPSFFWVVRDFSLQLISSDGQPISSKEYLEKALAPQKGFSDDIEEKNRIRRLLVSFFKQRECFTLVRPVIGQQQIQHLDQLDFDHLRPEFVDQVLSFRRRILGKLKPKVIKGKNLDGQMYLNLINSYLTSINNGAVPNIENAWNYICNEKCSVLIQQCIQIFSKHTNQIFMSNFPCSEQQLMMIWQRGKDISYNHFEKYAVGDNCKDYFTQLRRKIKNKIQQLKSQNDKQSINIHKSYILKNFNQVQKKLILNQYKNFQQFIKGITHFYNTMFENGPNLPHKEVIYLDFIKKIISQAAEIFLKKVETDLEKTKLISDEKEKILSNNLEKQQKNYQQEIETLSQNNKSLSRQNNQLNAKLQSFSVEIQQLVQKYQTEAERIQRSYQQKITQIEKKQIDQQTLVTSLKEKIQLSQSEVNQLKKQLDKDKAIHQFKVKQLNNQLQEMKNKQKLYEIQFQKFKNQMDSLNKQSGLKFQKKNSQLIFQLKEIKEKYSQMLDKNSQLEEKFKYTLQQKITLESKLKQDLQRKNNDLNKYKMEIELSNNLTRSEFQGEKQQLNRTINKLLIQKQAYLNQIKQLKDNWKIQSSQSSKQAAILKQKIQFLELNISESKDQFIRMKESYESQLQSAQATSNERLMLMQISKIQQAEEQSIQTIKCLQVQIENLKKKYAIEGQQWKKAKADIQFDYKITLTKYENQTKQLKNVIIKIQSDLQQQIKKKQQNQYKINQILKAQQQSYQRKIKQLENHIEQVKQKAEIQQRQYHRESQQNIMQLRNYYQIQKQQLENKISMDKEKYQKRIKVMGEQFQGRIQDQTGTIQEQYQQLKNDYMNMQTTLQQALSKLQHENDIKVKNVQNLQKMILQSKEKYQKNQKDLVTKLQKLNQSHHAQKQTLYHKIDQLHQAKNRSDKQIMNLNHNKEKLQINLQKKQIQCSNIIEDLNNLKLLYQSSSQDYRVKVNQLSNHFMEQKVNYEKMIALAKQQNQFYQRKMRQIQKNSESLTLLYEQKIKKLKQQFNNDFNLQSEKYINEISTLEQKYEKLKKTSKQTQSSMSKIINNHQKERAIQHQKFSHLETKIKQFQQMKLNESQNYQAQLITAKNSLIKEKKQYEDQIIQLKNQLSNIQNEKNSILNQYDKDKILWENKFKFFEENRQKNKKEYTQSIKKLQLTIDNLNKSKTNQKQNSEALHNEHITKVQKRHWSQIQQLNEAHSKRSSQLEAIIKKMEVQIRTLTEKFAYEQQNRAGNQVFSDRRLKQLLDNQKRLISQNQRLKAQIQSQSTENISLFEKQKQTLKNKLLQRQQKLKNMEKIKQNLFFEFQKQRARWNLQKENISMKQDQLKDVISKYQRDLEKLQRQNQKLRVEKKCSKISLPGANRYSNYSLERGLSRSSLQSSIQKQNFSPLLGDMSFFKNE